LAYWDIKTGIKILAPEYECPMCGAPTKRKREWLEIRNIPTK